MFFCLDARGINKLYWNNYLFFFFVYCEKINFLSKMSKKHCFADQPVLLFLLSCLLTNKWNRFRLIKLHENNAITLISSKHMHWCISCHLEVLCIHSRYKNREILKTQKLTLKHRDSQMQTICLFYYCLRDSVFLNIITILHN